MMALTLWPEWAYAVAHLGKRIENRTWMRRFIIGQRIAIHGGLIIGGAKGDPRSATQDMIATAREAGAAMPGPISLRIIQDAAAGKIVATALVSAIVDSHPSPWFCGPWGWVLAEVRVLEVPVPCRGSIALWPVPGDVASLVGP